eukprot:4556490-Prymnesium_polylepis.2
MPQVERKVLEGIDREYRAAGVVEVVQPQQRIAQILVAAVAGVAAQVDHCARAVIGPQGAQVAE